MHNVSISKMHKLYSIRFIQQSKLIIITGIKIDTLATGQLTPGRLSKGRPRSVISVFFFNKVTFLHQQKIVPKMEDRAEQDFQRSA